MTEKDAEGDDPAIVAPTGLEFKITDTKLYVPVVTLSIKWNKCRSQITIQPKNNNLNHLIDPTFTNAHTLLVLSFTRDNAGDNRDSF